MKVFLIDDSPKVIERLQEMIAPIPGVELVGYAADIPGALRVFRTKCPDVVVLDLHLPGGNGIQVLQTIKKEKPETVVIVLTNCAFPQYEKKCAEAGAHSFLDKSKDFGRVPRVIQALSRERDHGKHVRSGSDFEAQPRLECKEGSR